MTHELQYHNNKGLNNCSRIIQSKSSSTIQVVEITNKNGNYAGHLPICVQFEEKAFLNNALLFIMLKCSFLSIQARGGVTILIHVPYYDATFIY